MVESVLSFVHKVFECLNVWCVTTLNLFRLVTGDSPHLLRYWTHLITSAAYVRRITRGASGIGIPRGRAGHR